MFAIALDDESNADWDVWTEALLQERGTMIGTVQWHHSRTETLLQEPNIVMSTVRWWLVVCDKGRPISFARNLASNPWSIVVKAQK